jgi:protein PhnA
MSVETELKERSGSVCELCSSADNLDIYEVPPKSNGNTAKCAYLCATCSGQLDDPEKVDVNHWRCLNDSMWNTEPAVQVLAWRMLNRMSDQGWPRDLLDMMYLEAPTLKWAKATGEGEAEDGDVIHKDANGVILHAGDSVVLVKNLKVKGSSLIAKQGTAVRNISLDHDNATFIEGKVGGQTIVIITEYVKKLS